MNLGKSVNTDRMFFTSDWHFGHTNIIKYSNRPFKTVEEMNTVIIDNINKAVRSQDMLFCLGDVAFTKYGSKTIYDYMNAINCKNVYLVFGNHDVELFKNWHKYGRVFSSMDQILNIKIGDLSIVCCHYALRVWNKSHYGAIHLYGHSHGTLPGIGKSMDVGVDCNNYKPFSLTEILDIMKTKEIIQVDHHKDRS